MTTFRDYSPARAVSDAMDAGKPIFMDGEQVWPPASIRSYHIRREAYALLGEPDGPKTVDELVVTHQREEAVWECEIPVRRDARPFRHEQPTLRGSLAALRMMLRVWRDMTWHQRSRVVERAALALDARNREPRRT